MEKYRRFADASTGINPFVIVRNPTTQSVVMAALLFPFRLCLALLFTLPLVLLDLFVYLLYLVGLAVLARLLLAPLQRLCVRGVLFSLTHLRLARGVTGGSVRSSPRGGDVLLAPMQSVWDVCVLEVATPLPLALVVFPGGDLSPLAVYAPSPVQRWRVWAHVRRSGSAETLRQTARRLEANGGVALAALQRRGAHLGLPLLLFPEGSCSNGKGVLHLPPIHVAAKRRAAASKGGEDGGRVWVAAVEYDTHAVHTVLPARSGVALLFEMSAALRGSRDPAWASPPFPAATVRLAALPNDTANRPRSAGMNGDDDDGREVRLDGESVQKAMCAASRARRPLGVGLKEKLGYVEAYLSQGSRK